MGIRILGHQRADSHGEGNSKLAEIFRSQVKQENSAWLIPFSLPKVFSPALSFSDPDYLVLDFCRLNLRCCLRIGVIFYVSCQYMIPVFCCFALKINKKKTKIK